MKKHLLLFPLLVAAQAQAPGYLGKRFYLKTELSSMFATRSPTANNRGNNHYGNKGGGTAFNAMYGLKAGYALDRQKALTLGVGYLQTGMVVNATTRSLYAGNGENYLDDHYLFYRLSGPTTSLGLQFFNSSKGAIAPMGSFGGVSLHTAFLTGDILDKRTTFGSPFAETHHAPLRIQPTFRHWTLGLELGQQLILFDRLVLSGSAELQVPLALNRMDYDGNDFYDRYDNPNQVAFEKAAFTRMAGHSLFMVQCGIGFLLF